MDVKPLDVNINELPKEIKIDMPSGVSDASLGSLIFSLKSQLEYDFRNEFESETMPDFHVDVLNTSTSSVVVRIEKR